MAREDQSSTSRRDLLTYGAAAMTTLALWRSATAEAAPPAAMTLQATDTAVVFIDPQNDVLSEKGTSWGAVGASVTENRTVENMERLFIAARQNGYAVLI